MSSFRRYVLSAAVAAALVAGSAGAQLLPGVGLPPVSLPAPVGNLPVAGPVLQDVLASRRRNKSFIRRSTLCRACPRPLPKRARERLLDLRRLRLQELIRSNRNQLESDGNGQPVRRGVLVAVEPDPLLVAACGPRRLSRDRRRDRSDHRPAQSRSSPCRGE